jgi:hypothetical protein
MLKSLLINFKYNECFGINLLLENNNTKRKTLITLILLIKNIKNILITDVNYDKTNEEWEVTCKNLNDEQTKNFCEKIMKILRKSIDHCLFVNDDLITEQVKL